MAPVQGADPAGRDALRRSLREARRAFTGAARQDATAAIHARLLDWLPDPGWIGLYRAFDGEVQTADLEPALTALGWQIAHVRPDGQTLTFVRAERWTTVQGLPVPDGPPVPLEQLDVIVVPGVGFDHHGNRLGMGAGFYDRTLGQARALRVGLAFDLQCVPQLPTAPWDQPLHALITETRTSGFGLETTSTWST